MMKRKEEIDDKEDMDDQEVMDEIDDEEENRW